MSNSREISYPTAKTTAKTYNIKTETPNFSNMAKRGMSLESLINTSNEFYLFQEIACIHKKPTPIQVVNVEYKSRATARITEAYYTTPSTTDYNGVFNQKHIDFEAKQTNLSSLPFHNFHKHQIEHMTRVTKQGGICFVIIYFVKFDVFYLIPSTFIVDAYAKSKNEGQRKSISAKIAAEIGYAIELNSFPPIDYLQIIKQYYQGGAFVGK
ncbi:Holliday junction resolvase RecU [Erysipelotrichaceae bacterium]|nr:Holliday junction resolvase RecU [Erysipelotrichaceae bacterium]